MTRAWTGLRKSHPRALCDVKDTLVTDDGARRFHERRPDCMIIWGDEWDGFAFPHTLGGSPMKGSTSSTVSEAGAPDKPGTVQPCNPCNPPAVDSPAGPCRYSPPFVEEDYLGGSMADAPESSAAVIRLPTRIRDQRSDGVRGHRIGTLVAWKDREPLVDYLGNPYGPLPARLLDSVEIARDRPLQNPPCEVLLVFQEERADLPVIVGVVKPSPFPFTSPGQGVAPGQELPETKPEAKPEAKIDGKRVTLTARDEIELRCGEASIVLRRNGRVVIRGAYLETRSRGTHRIRGGTVEIN